MTKRTRTILFFVCLFLFLIIGTGIVFYLQGYRFDFERKKIVQTGGLFFKVLPKNAKVYIEGRLKKKTEFFWGTGTAFIENLLPKKYQIRVEKDGFHNWEKLLEVEEKQVTEAKNIVLIPKEPKFNVLVKEIEDFFFSPDEKKIVLKIPLPQSQKRNFDLKLFEPEKNLLTNLIKDDDFIKKEEEEKINLLDLKFSFDSKKILLKLGPEKKYFLLELDKTPPFLFQLDFLENDNVTAISFHPRDSQKIYFLRDNKLTEGNLVLKEILPLSSQEIISYSIFNEDIYYLDSSGFFYKTDFSFNTKEKINQIPFSPKEGLDYQIKVFSSSIFLKEDNVLYYFDKEIKSFQKIFDQVKDFKISSDLRKIVYFNDYEIGIFFLEKIEEQPRREKEEKLFLTRFSEKIGDLFWFTDHYLIFNVGDKIKIAEIDNRDRINIVDLISFKEPKIFWNQTDKKLYLESEGNLFSSQKLIL